MEGFVYFNQELERAKRAIEAASVFRDNAPAIARACFDAMEGEAVIAVVEPDLTFKGVWVVEAEELPRKLSAWNDGRWTPVFLPGCNLPEIEARCEEMEKIARARWSALNG